MKLLNLKKKANLKKAESEKQNLDNTISAFNKLSNDLSSYESTSSKDSLSDDFKNASSLQISINRAISSCNPEDDFISTNDEVEKALSKLADDARKAEELTNDKPISYETEAARRSAEESSIDALNILAAQQGILNALVEDEDDDKERVALKAAADIIGKNIEPLVRASASTIYDGDDSELSAAISRILDSSRKVKDDVIARRKRLIPEGMEGDEILEAAFAIEDQIIDNESETRTVVELDALDLSGLMQQLAIAAKANDRPRVLEIGKLIKAKVRELCKHSDSVANSSGHAPTISAMLNATSLANNFGIQLAILCSVKAASEGEDPTMKSNLIKCAKEIAKAVVEMVKLEKVSELMKRKTKK